MEQGQFQDFDANVPPVAQEDPSTFDPFRSCLTATSGRSASEAVTGPPEVASYTPGPAASGQGTLVSLATELGAHFRNYHLQTQINNLNQRVSHLEKMVTGLNKESDSGLDTLRLVQANFSVLYKKIADLEVRYTGQATVASSEPLPMAMRGRGDAHSVETLGSTEDHSASDFAELSDYVLGLESACETMIEKFRDVLDVRVTGLEVKEEAREEEMHSLRRKINDLEALVLSRTTEGQQSSAAHRSIRSQWIKEEPDESR